MSGEKKYYLLICYDLWNMNSDWNTVSYWFIAYESRVFCVPCCLWFENLAIMAAVLKKRALAEYSTQVVRAINLPLIFKLPI